MALHVSQIYADDYAFLKARKDRDGVPICRQIHDALMAAYGLVGKDDGPKPEKYQSEVASDG